MWVFTHDGYFSVVFKDCKKDELNVRARLRGDIERLCEKLNIPHTKIVELERADYRFRVNVTRAAFGKYMVQAVESIDYNNFKSSLPHNDPDYSNRSRAYMQCWSALFDMQAKGVVRSLFGKEAKQ